MSLILQREEKHDSVLLKQEENWDSEFKKLLKTENVKIYQVLMTICTLILMKVLLSHRRTYLYNQTSQIESLSNAIESNTQLILIHKTSANTH